jgi:hypothetical protein
VTSPEVPSDDAEDEALIQTIFGSLATPLITLDEVAAATADDSTLQAVKAFIIEGWPHDKRQVPTELRCYLNLQNELSVCHNGQCIVRGCRTVIPGSLRQAVLELAHEGHPGIVRMKQKCRDAIWFPGIDAEIERFVRECEACTVTGKATRPTPGPLQPLQLPSGPWRKLAIDIAGEFKAAPHHQRYVIVAVDLYSKWPEAEVCGSVTSTAVIEFLTNLFNRYGLVDEIVSDNGVQFVSAEFQTFLRSLNIKHSRSALYAPQTNGAVERFNRVLKEGLRTSLAEGRPFLTGLRQILATYRTTPHQWCSGAGTQGDAVPALLLPGGTRPLCPLEVWMFLLL